MRRHAPQLSHIEVPAALVKARHLAPAASTAAQARAVVQSLSWEWHTRALLQLACRVADEHLAAALQARVRAELVPGHAVRQRVLQHAHEEVCVGQPQRCLAHVGHRACRRGMVHAPQHCSRRGHSRALMTERGQQLVCAPSTISALRLSARLSMNLDSMAAWCVSMPR